jgi:RNA polymerase sigma-70 factor (ECF subfamily)
VAGDDYAHVTEELLELYDSALPLVYGYLLPRCGGVALAEDLTVETFLAAVDEARRGDAARLGVPWIVGVARHTLMDHWRRQYRDERRRLRDLDDDGAPPDDGGGAPFEEDTWDAKLDAVRAHGALQRLGPHHRAALTLRYLDDLPVPRVAAVLDRSVHATEALLVGARAAFRRAYEAQERRMDEPYG